MSSPALPDDSAALADRLGRYLPADHRPGQPGRGRRAERSAAPGGLGPGSRPSGPGWPSASARWPGEKWGVSLGSVDLADVPIAAVRETILVSDSASQVFAGTLQEAIDPHGRLTLEQAEAALLHGRGRGRLHRHGRRLAGPAGREAAAGCPAVSGSGWCWPGRWPGDPTS